MTIADQIRKELDDERTKDNPEACLANIRWLLEETERPYFDELKPGESFWYKGIEWVVLGEEHGGVLCITRKPIAFEPFDTKEGNNWMTSSLREMLDYFAYRLLEEDLIKRKPDLTADNGGTSYNERAEEEFVSLLSCEEYRKYRDIMPKIEDKFWTCTPVTDVPEYGCSVRTVNDRGFFGDCYSKMSLAVMPTVIFKK